MKKLFLVFLFFIVILNFVYSQQVPVIGVMVLEARGSGVTAADTVNVTNRIISELSSWGTVRAVQGTAGAEYIIRGTILKQGNDFILSGSTVNAANNQVLNEYREQIPISSLPVFAFCAKAVEKVPFPNYLAGTWQASINMPDGPVVCIIEFRNDRTVRVTRYDTWEHKQGNALRYEGYGTGTYAYISFANRTITLNGQQARIDASFNISLALEETLPDQTTVNLSGLNIIFNSDKNAFNIVNGMLPCGRNYDGPSVHPSEYLGFSGFTKIR